MKKITVVLFIALLLIEAAFAVTGDMVTIYKTDKSSVTSLSVCSPNDWYHEYVSAYGNDGKDLTIRAYWSNGGGNGYEPVSGTKHTVEYGESWGVDFPAYGEFVRIKLSGWGHGIGELTAK